MRVHTSCPEREHVTVKHHIIIQLASQYQAHNRAGSLHNAGPQVNSRNGRWCPDDSIVRSIAMDKQRSESVLRFGVVRAKQNLEIEIENMSQNK